MIEFKPGTVLPAASEARIATFERDFKVRFPAPYRWILENGNGAVPVRQFFDHGRNTRVLERFLAILDDTKAVGGLAVYSVDVVIAQIDARLIAESELDLADEGKVAIPIGALFAGDMLCLDFRSVGEDLEPKVVIWLHEESDDGLPVFDFVANSFAEFLEMLYE